MEVKALRKLEATSNYLGMVSAKSLETSDGINTASLTALIPMLVKAIQELSAQNDELTTRS
jgi:hypothetical protein